jgi:hypothetical protein
VTIDGHVPSAEGRWYVPHDTDFSERAVAYRSDTMPREPARSGAEQDVTTAWRKMYCYTKRAGVTSRIKRQIRRRERQVAKRHLLRS